MGVVWASLASIGLWAVSGCTAPPAADEGETGGMLECDVPQMFEQRCGSETCHGGGSASASGLDLISPGVEDRLSGAPGTNCAGVLADPADPEASILYTKVSDPSCGVLMPIGGEPLSEDELTCVSYWISGLLPPGGECLECLCEPGEVASCYEGREGTADVGMCKPGTHMCLTSGMGWTDCEGQILPRGEDCFTADVDENCDGFTPACSETWSLSFGDEEDDGIRSVAIDAQGSIYSFGDIEGTVSFGGEPLVAAFSGDTPKPDIVIAKHDHYGNPVWSKNWGDNSTQISVKLQIDQGGDLVGLSRMYGGIDMGGGHLQAEGGMEVLMFKLDPEGNHIWSLMVGGPDADRAERFTIDSGGDVIVSGTFTDNATFGADNYAVAGLRDAFVMKIDGASGSIEWVRVFGGTGDDYGFGVDVDSNDNIIVAGRFSDSLTIGADELTSAGDRDIFLAELGPDGAPTWARSFGGPGLDEAHDLRVQQDDNIVVLGTISETVDFGGGPQVSAGMRDIAVVTFDGDGNHVWSNSWGDALDQQQTDEENAWLSMRLDEGGNIFVGGSLYGTLEFGNGQQLVAAGDGTKPDVFYFELGPDGSYKGGRNWGGIGSDLAYDLEVADTGQVVLVGRFTGTTLDFGTGIPLIKVDRSDAYIAKLATN